MFSLLHYAVPSSSGGLKNYRTATTPPPKAATNQSDQIQLDHYRFYDNPGKFESQHEKSDIFDLTGHCWTGLQFNLQNFLHKDGFLTCHSLALGKKENVNPLTGEKDDERAAYNFFAYVKNQNWTVNGRFGTGGSLRGVLEYESPKYPFSGVVQSFIGRGNFHLETDFAFNIKDSCIQLKYMGSAIGAAYTQKLSQRLSLGTEFLTTGAESRLKYLFKYDKDKSTSIASFTSGLGPNQFSLSYTHPVFSFLDYTAGLDLTQSNKSGWSSLAKLGYVVRYETKEERDVVAARGYLDTSLKACVTIEEQLSERLQVQACVNMDFLKEVYEVGFGFTYSA